MFKLISCEMPYPGYMSRIIKGFTLAEVLITLGIIGVIAALTIPNLVANYKEKQTITKLKKVYSTFSNAYQLTIKEYGTPDTWDEINFAPSRTQVFWDRLKPTLKFIKECNANNRFECWDADNYFTYLNGDSTQNHIHNGKQITSILNDGTMIAFNAGVYYDTGCARNGDYFACADLTVKTDNSQKQVYGKNIFVFRFEHNLFVPSGKKSEPNDCYSNSTGCTAWVIFNGNMDYLRCKDDLSWNGKSKCN